MDEELKNGSINVSEPDGNTGAGERNVPLDTAVPTWKRTERAGEPRADAPLRAPSAAPGKKKPSSRKRKKKKNGLTVGIVGALAAIVLVIAGMFLYNRAEEQKRQAAEVAARIAAEEALRAEQERQRIEFEQLANSTVFLDGITVNGIPIGGMTLAEATDKLTEAEKAALVTGELQFPYGTKLYSISLNSILTDSDLALVLSEAYHLGKSGDYAAITAEIEDVKTNGRVYKTTRAVNSEALHERIAELAALIDTPAKDASITNINAETRTFDITDEVVGLTLDQAALEDEIVTALDEERYVGLILPVIEVQPTVTKEELSGSFVLRGRATTDFSSSASERKYNIRKGAGLINGTVLKPGEEFSTNDTLGTRTTKNGWKMAGAYENGTTVEQAGGGVCQLSTTLYNAAVKSDLEITSRRNHSMPVAYIDKGLDATINSVGNLIDFKFKNNTDGDILIFGYTTDNKTVTFEIYGKPFATDEYDEIRLTSKQVSVEAPASDPVILDLPEGTEKPNGSLLRAGEEYVAVTPRNGYTYQSYKNFYKNGTLVRSEPLARSNYKAFIGEIWRGPAIEATPAPHIEDGLSEGDVPGGEIIIGDGVL